MLGLELKPLRNLIQQRHLPRLCRSGPPPAPPCRYALIYRRVRGRGVKRRVRGVQDLPRLEVRAAAAPPWRYALMYKVRL